MGRRAGRPRKPNGRTKHINFPATELEDAVIRHKVATSGLILAEYMRQVAMHGEVKMGWTEEERFRCSGVWPDNRVNTASNRVACLAAMSARCAKRHKMSFPEN